MSKKVKHRHRHRHRHRHTENKDASKWHRRSGVIGLMYMYTFKKHYHENKSKKSIKVHTLVKHCNTVTVELYAHDLWDENCNKISCHGSWPLCNWWKPERVR